MADAYRRAGLARNPFVLEPPGALDPALYLDTGAVPIAAPVARAAAFIEITGPKGAGKSTNLLRWREQRHGPYRHVPPGPGRFKPLPLASIVYWDETYRVPAPLLALTLRRAVLRRCTVVSAGHESVAEFARGSGLEVQVYELPALSPCVVQRFFERRLAAVRLDGKALATPSLPDAIAERIARDCGHSLRAASDMLHAWTAAQVGGWQDKAAPTGYEPGPEGPL